jgi:hypothetical protein
MVIWYYKSGLTKTIYINTKENPYILLYNHKQFTGKYINSPNFKLGQLHTLNTWITINKHWKILVDISNYKNN